MQSSDKQRQGVRADKRTRADASNDKGSEPTNGHGLMHGQVDRSQVFLIKQIEPSLTRFAILGEPAACTLDPRESRPSGVLLSSVDD